MDRSPAIEGKPLQMSASAQLAMDDEPRVQSLTVIERSPRASTPKAKVMVVDDDPALCQALSVRLRASGYQPVTARDGYSALALALREHPAVILLDLGLPAGDGFSVLKNLRRFPDLASIPVVVLTARDPLSNEMLALDAGAIEFFQKAADNKELMETIRMCVNMGSGSSGPLVV